MSGLRDVQDASKRGYWCKEIYKYSLRILKMMEVYTMNYTNKIDIE